MGFKRFIPCGGGKVKVAYWANLVAARDDLVKIDSISFGSIIVDGKKHKHDVTIFPDGQPKRRKGSILMFGSHVFKRKKFEEMHKRGAEVLVIGAGTSGVAEVAEGRKVRAIVHVSARTVAFMEKLKHGHKILEAVEVVRTIAFSLEFIK